MASMAVEEDERKITLGTSKRSPDSDDAVSGNKNPNDTSPQLKVPLNSKDFIISVASNIASQPLKNYDSDVWGVLTAISSNARKRRQGINILLTCDEHCIGRMVGETSFRIESGSVSANHCKIYREKVIREDRPDSSSCMVSVFLKDTSTNGTYVNWERLRKNSSGVRIQHGDIISLASPPEHDAFAFAFVYREVVGSSPMLVCVDKKRKTEDFARENKRTKGIGIGAPDGPISLDDFKSLQRSNTELRKQLESQVLIIDTLRNESRAIIGHHENEIKQIKESIAISFQNELTELRNLLDAKQKQLAQVSKLSAEQKHSIDDLGERLSASLQSFSEANEIIKSQKAAIAELKTQLDEERHQRIKERESAASELKAVMHKCQTEAQEELKRFSDAAMRQEREQQELINKLRESERERSTQVEILMSKLEDTRQKLVFSDNRVRQLEAQVSEEQLASANSRKRVEELELETKRLQKDLESEKAAREDAWAKVSALELEISAAMRDLDVERQRLRGARERIMLRETQLRAFYSTTEEISVLFAKQQEQLKAMQKTLEDEEENCDNTSVDIDLNPIFRSSNRADIEENEIATRHVNAGKARSSTSGQGFNINEDADTSTEKHDCEIMSQEGQNTQEAEYTSTERIAKGGFGSDLEGIGTAPILDTDIMGTEQVNETQSPGNHYVKTANLNKSMQMDYETQAHESGQHDQQSRILHDDQRDMEDTEGIGTIRTADLLASEVAGSWACSTAPSVHGENETQRSREDTESQTPRVKEVAVAHDSAGQVAESQNKPSSSEFFLVRRKDNDRRSLSEMIGIVATDPKEQFTYTGNDQAKGECDSVSDSETESCSDSDERGKEKDNSVLDLAIKGHSDNDNNETLHSSDADTIGSDGDLKQVDTMDEDDEAT